MTPTASATDGSNRFHGSCVDADPCDGSACHSDGLCGIRVILEHEQPALAEKVRQLWRELFVVTHQPSTNRDSCVRLQWSTRFDRPIGNGAQLLCDANALRVEKLTGGFLLDCGAATLHVDLTSSVGCGSLRESFFHLPPDGQRRFLLLALVMLIRQHDCFALHSSGVSQAGRGCLIAGHSGSGKTTLSLSLIRQGWSNLSDDVVALRDSGPQVDALAVTRGFSCTPETQQRFVDLVTCKHKLGDKRIMYLADASPQPVTRCRPNLLLFPKIEQTPESRLIPMSPLDAVNELVQFSAGIMVNRGESARQLQTLGRLVAQSRAYRMIAGQDVYQNPQRVARLIGTAAGSNEVARIVIELTNRCNLSCQHCFSGRHGGKDDLPLSILDRVLAEARPLGFDSIAFTGGDPTVYAFFPEALARTSRAGYPFGMVTNGWNFVSVYPQILEHREHLNIITLSLDGATEATHDALRGKGSFRRVLQAASICVIKDIPFSINMVVTRNSRREVERMAELAADLGSRGLRYGHLMHSPITTQQGQDLTPAERKEVESEIWELQRQSAISISMGPGYFTQSLFPCAPLQMQEVNVDRHGNLTKCCHLSGHDSDDQARDVIGNLAEMTLTEALRQLVAENHSFHEMKELHRASGEFQESDFFPCWYCSLHYAKVDWLKEREQDVWRQAMPDRSVAPGPQDSRTKN